MNLVSKILEKVSPKRDDPNLSVIKVNTLLVAKHYREGKLLGERRVVDRVVTTAFVNALVDALEAATYINDYKYHGSGIGTNAEASSDTALQSAIAEARDSGTQIDGATANVYKSVATHTYAGTFAVTEHGLFNASSSGTLMDRTVFSAINVVSGDKIEFTFQITFAAGG